MAPHLLYEDAVAPNLALAIVATSTTPLLLLDKDLNVVAASTSFCSAFQIDASATPGRPLAGLGAGEWNIPQLSSLLKVTAEGFAAIDGYEINFAREGDVPRILILSAKKLEYAENSEVRLVLSIADITDARAAEKLKNELLREKDILLRELHHRVANSLQIIASVLLQSARKVQSEETRTHLHDAHHRVMSVAALQQQLAASKLGDVELRPYLTALCESIGASMIHDHDKVSLDVTADDSVTTADTSISLGLIVTELAINALKHAFPGNREGRIFVDYNSRGPNWTLSVRDDGVGMPKIPENAKAGLGSGIIEALANQLSANITVSRANPGTKVSVVHTSVPVLVCQTDKQKRVAI